MITTDKKKKLNAGRAKSMNKFADALLSLMREKSFSDISITDLSVAAGLVRKTFYRNFDCKEDILRFKLDCFFEEIAARFDFSTAGVDGIYLFCFDYLIKNRDVAVMFTDRFAERTVVARIREYIDASYSETLHGAASFEPSLADFYSAFVADGMFSIVRTWINNGCKQQPAVMARLTQRLLSGVIS